MPFWRLVQRCANCLHWKTADPSAITGLCQAPRAPRTPFYAETPRACTGWDSGTNCPAYTHGKNKSHPLDQAAPLLNGLIEGDRIGLRTYRHGEGIGGISRAEARVLRVTQNLVSVQFMGGVYRLRIGSTERLRAGTVLEMPDWGLDMDEQVQRADRPKEQMQTAVERLKDVTRGSKIKLLGYPPFDGKTKRAHVLKAGDRELIIRCGHGPKLRMYRTGPMAGLIANDPTFVLDTRE